MDFIYQLEGIRRTDEQLEVHFHNADGRPRLHLRRAAWSTRPVRFEEPIFGDAFDYLQSRGAARG